MALPVAGFDPARQIRSLLEAIQNSDRAEVLLHLVEIGMWLSATPDPCRRRKWACSHQPHWTLPCGSCA